MGTPDTASASARKRRRYRGEAVRLRVRDGRSAIARRWRAAFTDLARELGREPTAAERALLVDAAALAVAAEEPMQAAERLRVSYALADALRRLGLPRPARREPEPDPRAEALARIEAFRRGE